MSQHKRITYIILKILIIIIINIFLLKNIGNKYLKKFDIFIGENNKLYVKNKVNEFILKNKSDFNIPLYHVTYNDDGEIVNLDLNINEVNMYLQSCLSRIKNILNSNDYNSLNKYYQGFKSVSNNNYYVLPIGIISDNPFLYNSGPKVIFYYDLINTPILKFEVNVKNYGINNALVETYLIINIDQSILKPVLYETSSYKYKYLLSSKIINGRISNYLGTNLSISSDAVSS